MAEYTPPTDNVPIFDVTNFVTSGSGLTEAQVASKFLRFPTGQGTETLPALITGSITAPNTMDIVMPNSSATNVLNVGVVSRNISGQVHHYSDGDNCIAGSGVHLNNGLNNNSATNIANGDGSSLGSASGGVNIKSGLNNTGTIAIGKYTTNTNQTTTTISGASNISTTGGIVNIGNQTSRTEAVNIANGNTSSSNLNLNSGLFNTGNVNIMNGASSSGNVNIGLFNTTTNIVGTTNINGAGSTNGQLITIGNATAGTTTLNSNTINIGNINSLIYMESASLNIQNAVSSTLNIMAGNSLGSIANIMTGTNNTNTLTVGNTGTTIGINGTTTITGNTFINNTGSSNTTIGATGTTTTVNGTLNTKQVFIGAKPDDSSNSITMVRNGQFTIGVGPTANPKLIMGVTYGSSPGNEVQILSLTTGAVYSNSGILTNTSPSDETLKKNISSLDVSIDELNPVQYEWIDNKMGTGIKYGFLANEVNEIFPNICSSWKTDEVEGKEPEVKLGMDTVSIIPIIVSAMKKMKQDYEQRLSKLEERIIALEGK